MTTTAREKYNFFKKNHQHQQSAGKTALRCFIAQERLTIISFFLIFSCALYTNFPHAMVFKLNLNKKCWLDIGHALWKWANVRTNETTNFHFLSFEIKHCMNGPPINNSTCSSILCTRDDLYHVSVCAFLRGSFLSVYILFSSSHLVIVSFFYFYACWVSKCWSTLHHAYICLLEMDPYASMNDMCINFEVFFSSSLSLPIIWCHL